ncbi:hypothetical protein LY76DRAFT_580271 [Colletotrichum caudatum]|nr:hypothetical protein LY76DRAFT_580271 [Colletotrichum caudatum]
MTNANQPSGDADNEPKSVAPIETVVYDGDGDLTILIGYEPNMLQCQVESKTLSRSSPVFKKMLFGGFAESRPSNGEDWVVHLPEDDFLSMKIMFSIAHGAFDQVPKSLSVHDLYTLLAHTDKYDSIHLLRPWARYWVDALAIKDDMPEPKVLCVAWEVGSRALFGKMMSAITDNCLIDADGNVICGPSKFSLNSLIHLMPPDIEDIIKEKRMRVVNAELQPFKYLYSLCRITDISICPLKEDGWKCDSMVLGSLIKALLGVGIDITMPNVVDRYKGSVSRLRRMLRGMDIVSTCDGCSRRIAQIVAEGQEEARQLWIKMEFMTDSQSEHLDCQARKTGF